MSVQFATKAAHFKVAGQCIFVKGVSKNIRCKRSIFYNFCTTTESAILEKPDDSKVTKKNSEQYFQNILHLHRPELLKNKILDCTKAQDAADDSGNTNGSNYIPCEVFQPYVNQDGVHLVNSSIKTGKNESKISVAHQRVEANHSFKSDEFNFESNKKYQHIVADSSKSNDAENGFSNISEDMSNKDIAESSCPTGEKPYLEAFESVVNDSPLKQGIENFSGNDNNTKIDPPKRSHKPITEDELIVPNLPEFEQPLSTKPNMEFVEHVAPITVKSFNIAPFVDKSKTLQQLVKLGVDLSKLEKSTELAEFYVKADFEKDMQEHIFFLHRNGVTSDLLGTVISKNPWIFMEHLTNLQVRINYLESKKFDADAIARMITKVPYLLSMDTRKVDAIFGFYQKTFDLSGSEVRLVMVKYPKLIPWPVLEIKHTRFVIKELMGFTMSEMKTLLIEKPKIWTASRHHLRERFDYIHNVMRIPHEMIVQFPRVLLRRKFFIVQRHKYLKFIGRAQYDPKETGYICIDDALCTSDSFFCTEVLKTSVEHYNNFLKTL